MIDTLKAWCYWKRKEVGHFHTPFDEDTLDLVKAVEDVISQVGTWKAKYDRETARADAAERLAERYREALNVADDIILDIHAQITTFSKYTADQVYKWKRLRANEGGTAIQEFDDNGYDEDRQALASADGSEGER